jgi:antitoxin (DNA-binding transcriptional repressor) of toxin-antitoxin stability system
MSTHDVAEAEHNLSDLIDRALKGEAVVIARDGRPVAEIKPVKQPRQPITAEHLAWIESHRVKLRGDVDPGALVRQMRDDGP